MTRLHHTSSESDVNKVLSGKEGSYTPREVGGGFTKERTFELSLKE